MLNNHVNIQLKRGVKIITCDPASRLIEAETRNGEVISVNAYAYPPTMRWPIPGERWVVVEENGSWFLEGIFEPQKPIYEEFECGVKYPVGTIVTYKDAYYELIEEIVSLTPCKTPGALPWQEVYLPVVEPGDTVLSASSGRALLNNEGTLSNIPNGVKVPFIPEPLILEGSPTEKSLNELKATVNELRSLVEKFGMMEPERLLGEGIVVMKFMRVSGAGTFLSLELGKNITLKTGATAEETTPQGNKMKWTVVSITPAFPAGTRAVSFFEKEPPGPFNIDAGACFGKIPGTPPVDETMAFNLGREGNGNLPVAGETITVELPYAAYT